MREKGRGRREGLKWGGVPRAGSGGFSLSHSRSHSCGPYRLRFLRQELLLQLKLRLHSALGSRPTALSHVPRWHGGGKRQKERGKGRRGEGDERLPGGNQAAGCHEKIMEKIMKKSWEKS